MLRPLYPAPTAVWLHKSNSTPYFHFNLGHLSSQGSRPLGTKNPNDIPPDFQDAPAT